MEWYIPVLVFCARILDVSIGTVRIVLVIRGRKFIAAFLGFVEVLVWILAVSAVINNIRENLWTVIAFAAGFGVGTLVGMYIEEALAIGTQLIRVVNTDPELNVTRYLRENKFIVTELEAGGMLGRSELCFLVVSRKHANRAFRLIKNFAPKAFITIEDVRTSTSGSGIFQDIPSRIPLWKRFRVR
jgi:uncharacterized protein YebE (UPF0316 family)